MFSQYFGQYLFNEGILTAKQLYQIFEYKEQIKVKLGTLAMTSGLITAAQIEEILQLQKASPGRRFGEIAIDKGYLSVSQVEQLLSAQSNTQVNLSQAIADKGMMSLGELEKHLEGFYHQQYSQKLASTVTKPIAHEDIDLIVKMFMDFAGMGKSSEWYPKYVSFILRSASHFVVENPSLRRVTHGLTPSGRYSKNTSFFRVTQELPPEIGLKVSLVMKESTLAELIKRSTPAVPPEIAAAISEDDFMTKYFNMRNVSFLESELPSGTAITLSPPEITRQKQPFDTEGFRIPAAYSFGQIDILLEGEGDEE